MRGTPISCLLHKPQPMTWPETQACALTRDQTSDLSVCSLVLSPGRVPICVSSPLHLFYPSSQTPPIWQPSKCSLYPFLITSGEFIEICRLLGEAILNLSTNLTTRHCCVGLWWPTLLFGMGCPKLKLRNSEAFQNNLLILFRSFY